MRRVGFTHFTATTIPHVRIDAVCFGAPARSYPQRGRTIHDFHPGQLFGVVWWRWYAGDQQHRTLAILEAPQVRGEGDSVLAVHPAAIVHVFMDQYGPAGQERSVTPGLYIRSNAVPAIGQLVEFRTPVPVRSYIRSRSGHDGEDWYILKPVVAGPGDLVDTTGGMLRINRKIVAPMPPM